MLEACRAIERFVAGKTVGEYLANELLQAAVERKIQIIGEAATRISAPFRDSTPEIPWKQISGQRHVLVHDYGRIEHDRVWQVATGHVGALAVQLDAILPAER
jgi:uncharacterized protein with HEPN domain